MRLNYICIAIFLMLVPFVTASIVVVQDQGVEGLGKISWVFDAALASLLINGLLALPLLCIAWSKEWPLNIWSLCVWRQRPSRTYFLGDLRLQWVFSG